jgi:methylase of polypeptide subunit release factors
VTTVFERVGNITLYLQSRWIRSNRLLAQTLFGVNLLAANRIYWDFTTLALRRTLLEHVRSKDRVLEIGTGPYGLLSIMLAKRLGCSVAATDIDLEYCTHARRCALANDVAIHIEPSDLFEHVDGSFDLIFWNAVYIPLETGVRLGFDRMHSRRTDWCGGESGIEEISRFLHQASSHLTSRGIILVGFNPFYLRLSAVTQAATDASLRITDCYGHFGNPSRVARITRADR